MHRGFVMLKDKKKVMHHFIYYGTLVNYGGHILFTTVYIFLNVFLEMFLLYLWSELMKKTLRQDVETNKQKTISHMLLKVLKYKQEKENTSVLHHNM